MKNLLLLVLVLALLPVLSPGQMLNPEKLLAPATDTWPTYNGDYSGRRYSELHQIDAGIFIGWRCDGCFVFQMSDCNGAWERRRSNRRR